MTQRSALVTGGSRGIGLGIAQSLARRGYGLTITARDESTLAQVADELRTLGAPSVAVVQADLADRQSAEQIVEGHRREFDAMDVLVLNAGVGTAGSIAEYPMRRFDKTMDVNVRAPFELLQLSLPLLRTAAERQPQRGSKVIALSSLTGVYAEAGLAVYGATKAAMLSLIATLNAEEGERGVLGTALAPGYVATDMSAWISDKISPESMISVDDLVELVNGILNLSSRSVVSEIVVTRAGAGLQA